MNEKLSTIGDLLIMARKLWCEGYAEGAGLNLSKIKSSQMAKLIEKADQYFWEVYCIKMNEDTNNEPKPDNN